MLADLPANAASFGVAIDELLGFVTMIAVAALVIAELIIVWAVLRFRQREGRRGWWSPATTLKVQCWVLAPALVILGLDVAIEMRNHPVWHHIKGQRPPPDYQVRITGRQFAWTFDYPGTDGKWDTADDFQVASELVVAAGATIEFELTSVDVIHSLWIPALRVKQDAVPGRRIKGWFRAAPGIFTIACAELCGAGHTVMAAELRVLPPNIYEQWLAARSSHSPTTEPS